MSLWVTARIVLGPKGRTNTPLSRRRPANALASQVLLLSNWICTKKFHYILNIFGWYFFLFTRIIFVSTVSTSTVKPGSSANLWASACALWWSPFNIPRSKSSSACNPAAASNPAFQRIIFHKLRHSLNIHQFTCLIPPPRAFLARLAFLISDWGPTNKDPTGAPRPLERHAEIESTDWTKLDKGWFKAVAAFHIRAPSKWTGISFLRAIQLKAFHEGG